MDGRRDPGEPAVRLYKAEDLAERWGVPTSQVYRLARDGKVPAVRVGRYVRFHPDAVAEYERGG